MSRRKTNIIGRKLGRLTVIADDLTDSRKVIVRCECGNTKSITRSEVFAKKVRSCGCLHTEIMKKIGKYNAVNLTNESRIRSLYGTDPANFQRKRNNRNNKSGRTGVWRNPKTGRYISYIGYENRNIYLGSYLTMKDAVDARKAAEIQYYSGIVCGNT